MEQPKIERLLRLMKMMSGNTNFTVDELAERLGISYRSIYRYIDTFKESGFVVEKLHSNVYKLGKMPKSYVDLKRLIYFSEEEAYIINSLINSLDNTNALKTNLLKKLSAVYNSTSIANYTCNKESALSIESLGEAIKDRKKVILKNYESGNSHKVSDRMVEPFEFTTNMIDVWCYDLEKKENKVFKISRIGEVRVLEEEWSEEEAHRKSITDCFRMSGFEQTPVKLEMGIMAKNLLLEEYPLAEKDLKKEGDRWILETMVSDMAGVGRFVIGLAHDIKVIDSPELVEYIRLFVTKHLQ
jgi:predicted DNA-binding transcriptional regulator YafY